MHPDKCMAEKSTVVAPNSRAASVAVPTCDRRSGGEVRDGFGLSREGVLPHRKGVTAGLRR